MNLYFATVKHNVYDDGCGAFVESRFHILIEYKEVVQKTLKVKSAGTPFGQKCISYSKSYFVKITLILLLSL